MNITLYKTNTCPNCKMLKMLLDKKGISYQEITDIGIMKDKGISSIPVLEVDGELLDFHSAAAWVKQIKNN